MPSSVQPYLRRAGTKAMATSFIPICVQSYTIEVRNAHLNGVRLNAYWYESSRLYLGGMLSGA